MDTSPTVKRTYRVTELDAISKRNLELRQATLREFHTRSCVGFFDANVASFAASGTLVEIDGVPHVATAGHVVAYVMAHGRTTRLFHGVSAGGSMRFDYPVREIVVWSRAEKPRDIGLLSLTAETAAALRGRGMVFVTEDQLAPTRRDPIDEQVWVTGNPAAYRMKVRASINNMDAQGLVGLSTHVRDTDACTDLHHEGIDEEDGWRAPPGARDYHVDWSTALDEGTYRPLFPPSGVSGGGLWLVRDDVPTDVVWSIERAAILLGIAWYWHRAQRCVRCIPIDEWVQFARAGHALRIDPTEP